MKLLNLEEEIVETLTLREALHTDIINQANFLDFTCTNEIYKNDRVVYQDQFGKWHEFIVNEIIENKEDIKVYAEHSSNELRGAFIEDIRPDAAPSVHLERLLRDTRWSVGRVEFGNAIKMSYYRESVYSCLSELVTALGGEIEFEIQVQGNKVSKRVVNILEKRGEDNGKRFEYGKDLVDAHRNILRDEIITALYGFGRGEEIGDGYGRRISFKDLDKPDSPKGQMYITNQEALEKYGLNKNGFKINYFGKVVFDEIEDVEELYKATKKKLELISKPLINYNCQVQLLSDPHEGVQVGDTIKIIDNDFNGKELRVQGRVITLKRDLMNEANSVVEIGNYMSNIFDETLSMESIVNGMRDKEGSWDTAGSAFDHNGQMEGTRIKDILEAWNNEINQLGGFVYGNDGEGLTTYDAPIDENPTKVVQITGGTIRIANSKKSNGEWDWRTVLTADGIIGQEIMANSITTNQLSSEVGMSLDLSSNTSINQIVANVNKGNVIPNFNGMMGLTGWSGTGETLYIPNMEYVEDITYGTVAYPKFIEGSLSEWGLSFYNSGEMLSPFGIVIPDSDYSFRAKVMNFKPFTVTVHEYKTKEENSFKSTKFNFNSPKTYNEFTITPQAETRYIKLGIEVPLATYTDQVELTEMMFNRGKPKEWFMSADEVYSYASSSIKQTQEEIELRVEKDDIISTINQSAEEVSINANKVKLEGLTTINGGFKVLEDGTAEMVDANVSGTINAVRGEIGNFEIEDGVLTYTSTLYEKSYDYSDMSILQGLVRKEISPTPYMYDVYDFNNDDKFDAIDMAILEAHIKGIKPIHINIYSKIQIGTNTGEIKSTVYSSEDNKGSESNMRADKIETELLNAEGLGVKEMIFKGREVYIDSGFLKVR